MKTKQRKTIPKTRGHKVEKKPYVPIRKYASPHNYEGRKETDTKESCENSQREGDQRSDDHGGQEDKEKCKEVEQGRNTENSEESIHPGPVQTLLELHPQSADDTTSEKGGIESEELPPWQ
jgi:hypothetical protein